MSNKDKTKEIKTAVESPIAKHTPKSFVLALILGVIIGLAIIIPGVSGSTVAIIFGMYAALLYAIGNILGDFKRCVAYLFPIVIGAVVGFLGGFLVVQRVFEDYMFVLVCLFAGLMIGAVPAILNEIKGEKANAGRGMLLALGVILVLCVGVLSILLESGDGDSGASFSSFPPYLFILYIPLGAVVAATQIIPGLSATAVLMACGQFKPILNSLHLDYILENPAVLGLYLCIGGGFLAGLVLISKGFSALIAKWRGGTFFFVVGLSLGSIVSMFLNPDMWAVYTEWSQSGVEVAELIIGAVLLSAGFAASFLLTRYELKHGGENKE